MLFATRGDKQLRATVGGSLDAGNIDRAVVVCQVGFQMQQRPYLKICGARILGGVGNFQNKLTAIATAQVKVLIALAEQRLEPSLQAVMLSYESQYFAVLQPGGLGFNYRKRVCLSRFQLPQTGLPGARPLLAQPEKGAVWFAGRMASRSENQGDSGHRNGRSAPIRIQSGVFALGPYI
jgi:hypothetical protein